MAGEADIKIADEASLLTLVHVVMSNMCSALNIKPKEEYATELAEECDKR